MDLEGRLALVDRMVSGPSSELERLRNELAALRVDHSRQFNQLHADLEARQRLAHTDMQQLRRDAASDSRNAASQASARVDGLERKLDRLEDKVASLIWRVSGVAALASGGGAALANWLF